MLPTLGGASFAIDALHFVQHILRAKKLIQEWALLHQEELMQNWQKATLGKQIDRIEPLN